MASPVADKCRNHIHTKAKSEKRKHTRSCLVVMSFSCIQHDQGGFSGWERESGRVRSKELNEVFEGWGLACYVVLGESWALHEDVRSGF